MDFFVDLSLVSSFLYFELTHFELKYSNLSRLNTLLETQQPPGQYLLLVLLKPLKCQIHKKIKYTQTIRRLLPTNRLHYWI